MAWENFFICQKPQEALQGKLFFQKKFKTTASKINCHTSFHGQKQQNLVYWYSKSPQVQRECTVLAAVILACIRVPSVDLTAQMSGRAHFLLYSLVRSLQIFVYSQNSFIHSFFLNWNLILHIFGNWYYMVISFLSVV